MTIKNFEARNGRFETSAVVKNQVTKQREQRILGDCWQWKTNGQCSERDNCSFPHDVNKCAKMTQPNLSLNSFMPQDERKASRTRSPRENIPLVESLDGHARITSKGLAPIHSESGTLQNACSTRPRVVADLEKCSYAHSQVDEQPSKRSVAMLKKYELQDRTEQPVVDRDNRRESHHGPACWKKPTKHHNLWKRKPRFWKERPVVFRHPVVAARNQRKSSGWQSSWT